MGADYDTKTFRSGNSVAVRLPRELGVDADVRVRLERVGRDIHVKPIVDPAEAKRRIAAMLAELDALPPGGELGARIEIEIPDRAWL